MSVQPSAPEAGKRPAMTMHSLMKMLADGEKITMLTAYDAVSYTHLTLPTNREV